METKKSMIIIVLIVFLILAIAGGIVIYKNNNNKSTENITENNSSKSSVSYVVLEVENKDAQELEYKSKQITDKQKIEALMKIIDSSTLYEKNEEIIDFGDIPPCATIYSTNGQKYKISAGDEISDNGKTVNLMSKWDSEDESNKTLYQVNTKLGEYIEKLFNE